MLEIPAVDHQGNEAEMIHQCAYGNIKRHGGTDRQQLVTLQEFEIIHPDSDDHDDGTCKKCEDRVSLKVYVGKQKVYDGSQNIDKQGYFQVFPPGDVLKQRGKKSDIHRKGNYGRNVVQPVISCKGGALDKGEEPIIGEIGHPGVCSQKLHKKGKPEEPHKIPDEGGVAGLS